MRGRRSGACGFVAVVVLAAAVGGRAAADPPTHWGDLSVHEGTQYIGEDVYNTDGAGQTVAKDANAVYEVRLENVGSAADTFRVARRPGGSSSLWSVTVAPVVEGDLTTQGNCDWVTRLLDVGESIELEVSVQALPAASGGSACTVRLGAWAEHRPLAADVVRMQTTCQNAARPDLSFGSSPGGLGTLVYSSDGTGQTQAVTVDGWRAWRQFISVVNRANCADSITVTGTAGDAGWEVSYTYQGADVTSQVTGAGLAISLARGRAMSVLLSVRHQAWVGGDPPHTALVTGTSELDGTKVDAVRMVTSYPAIARPDLAISRWDGLVGAGVISSTGAGQTVSQTVENGVAAVYDLRVTNAGTTAGAFTLRGQGSTQRWLVGYTVTGTSEDITGAITQPDWSTPTLAPGEHVDIAISVTPRAGLDGGTVGRVWVTAAASPDETVVTLTTCAVVRRPDATVDGLGANVTNATGEGQTSAGACYENAAVTYSVTLTNRGNVAGTLRVTGPGDTGTWQVQYRDAHGQDITSAVTGTGWDTALARNRSAAVQIAVTPLDGTEGGSVHTVLLTCASVNDAAAVDAVGAATTCRPRVYRPDAAVLSGTSWIGEGILNLTGEGQTSSRPVVAGGSATHQLRIGNAGSHADTIRVTGPGGTGTWQVRYRDADDNDITAAVTGTGWAMPLAAGAYGSLAVLVTPPAGAQVGDVHAAQVLCTSEADAAKADAAGIQTTCAQLQPDAVAYVMTASENGWVITNYTGEGTINSTGEGQVSSNTLLSGAGCRFGTHCYNRGTAQDSFRLTAPVVGAPWTVTFRSDTGDVTPQVTGSGLSLSCNNGQPPKTGRVQIRVSAAADTPPGTTLALPLTYTSVNDPSKVDVVVVAVQCVPKAYQPDAYFASTGLGDGVVNDTGEGQTVEASRVYGETVDSLLRLWNRGNTADTIRLTGPAGDEKWRIKYYAGTASDITAAVVGGGYDLQMDSGARRYYKVSIEPLAGLTHGDTLSVPLTFRSLADPTKLDVLKVVVTFVAGAFQPDVSVALKSSSSYVGDGIVNPNGDGQTLASSAPEGETCEYHLCIINRGNYPDTYHATIAGNSDGWQASTMVRGRTVNPGEAYYTWLNVEPPFGAAGVTSTVLLTIASDHDPTKVDVVRADTTCIPAVYKWDAAIQDGTTLIGEDVINGTGDGQAQAQTVAAGGTASYEVRLRNEGNAADSVLICGTPGDARWQVSYTDWQHSPIAVGGDGWLSYLMGPRMQATVTIAVMASPGALPGESIDILVTGTSDSDPTKHDTVKLTTTVQ